MDINFPAIINTISHLQKSKKMQYVTTKRLRKIFKIPGEDLKQVRLIANTLSWLEMNKLLELVKKYPKLYKIDPDFAEKTRTIVQIYQH